MGHYNLALRVTAVFFYFESAVAEIMEQPALLPKTAPTRCSIRTLDDLLETAAQSPEDGTGVHRRFLFPDESVIQASVRRQFRPLNMTTYSAFHSQLTSIMEALTRAAVTEICELMDDSYAVLQLELSRSHQENEALRRKLELIESIIVRGPRGDAAAWEAAGGGLVDVTTATATTTGGCLNSFHPCTVCVCCQTQKHLCVPSGLSPYSKHALM